MELILIAILALVLMGSVDRRLHPHPKPRPAATRRAPMRRKGSHASAHRVSAGQARPFLSLGPSLRR